jgi:hypothetical protein
MKTKLLGLIVGTVLFGVTSATANTIYNVSDTTGTLTVSGTITTDGNTGLLVAGDILNWDMTVCCSAKYPTPSGGGKLSPSANLGSIYFFGDALSATPTSLIFNFSSTTPAGFSFTDLETTVTASWLKNFDGSLIGLVLDLNDTLRYELTEISTRSGSQIIATSLSPIPLPAALPLFATGLGALGLLGWRRKRKAAAIAA